MSANVVSFCRFLKLLYHCFTLAEVGRHRRGLTSLQAGLVLPCQSMPGLGSRLIYTPLTDTGGCRRV